MPFIAESIIESVAQQLDEAPDNYTELIREFQDLQPELMAYLLSEDTRFLTPEERDYLLYLSLVILQSVRSQQELRPIDSEMISKAEEVNWEKLEGVSSKAFRERLDVFFTNYPQEDLLAFVEDALIPDEDSTISKEGREPLFIALKTLIDLVAVDKKK